MRFRKQMLQVGRYHAGGQVVDITPARLHHWASEFRRMSNSGAVIPVSWDHASDPAELQPIPLSQYNRTRHSAKNTIGHLADFRVSADGQAAELTLDLRDDTAADKAERNLVYLSPVIFPKWVNGAGHEFRDCITHCDMVNHPVDQSQQQFVAASCIRFGNSEPFRLGDAMDDDDKLGDSSSGNDTTSDDAADDGAVSDENGKLSEVIAALGAMNIVLSNDTTPANFLNHLHQALLTAAAHRADQDGDKNNDGTADVNQQPPTIPEPPITGMSLQAQAAVNWADDVHRNTIGQRLDALLASGRCSAEEHKARRKQVPAIKLSIDPATLKPRSGELEIWLGAREAIPAGSYGRADGRSQVIPEPPATLGDVGGRGAAGQKPDSELSQQEIDEMVAFATGRSRTSK